MPVWLLVIALTKNLLIFVLTNFLYIYYVVIAYVVKVTFSINKQSIKIKYLCNYGNMYMLGLPYFCL